MKLFFNIFRKKIMASCGHETLKKDKVTAFGKSAVIKIPIVDGKTDYCHRCLEKMAIKCAWCGNVIFIGSPVTLYMATKKDFKIPEHAVIYNENPLQLVGCRRCAELGSADWMGYWVPPGKVQRVMSPTEVAIQSNKVVLVE